MKATLSSVKQKIEDTGKGAVMILIDIKEQGVIGQHDESNCCAFKREESSTNLFENVL